MGLLDDVIARQLKYIGVSEFLCYLAYTQNEKVKTVAKWLHAEDFEEDIISFIIEDYKITEMYRDENDEDDDYLDFLTDNLFKRIKLKGFNTMKYRDGETEECFDMDYHFFYKIEDLNEFSYLARLNLDFRDAKNFRYSVHIDDRVTATRIEDSDTENKIITPVLFTSTRNKSEKKEEEQKKLDRAERRKDPMYRYIDDVLEWIATEVPNDGTDDQDNDNEIKDNTKYSYLTTIGALLELMLTPKWGLDSNRALFQSQSAIINKILEKGLKGQGKTTLENRFRDANTALDDAKKKSDNLPRS